MPQKTSDARSISKRPTGCNTFTQDQDQITDAVESHGFVIGQPFHFDPSQFECITIPLWLGDLGVGPFAQILYGWLEFHKAPGTNHRDVYRETLAREMNVSVSTVARGIAQLKKAGVLRADHGRAGKPTRYTFLTAETEGTENE